MVEQAIMEELRAAAREHPVWMPLAVPLDNPDISVHLAVMLEPFLTYIIDGKKTIESRFSKNAIAPYERVAVGDLVFLKLGSVFSSFRVASVECVKLHDGELDRVRRDYAEAIGAQDDEFWNARADKRFATLMGIEDVRELRPAAMAAKRDMRGWVVLRAATRATDQLALL
jgi:hypothetical protein